MSRRARTRSACGTNRAEGPTPSDQIDALCDALRGSEGDPVSQVDFFETPGPMTNLAGVDDALLVSLPSTIAPSGSTIA